ncbi:MAG TPA: tRNA pseudouridine(38-40) synthase TruA [Bacteroidales bacterium]|nr:tRNA pseudouridine(38-40) synthase TruA [Bacteroidales bacterium]MDI9573851.1 tRNA pseudouridine(38-40) synthase TruA [Bacteroidota bacterium]OQC58315.1 MAG: tRNA pseudouridine synthase A [Bacteroidetes bacterium ADurb.Bin012]MBP9511454.1 tRNA pseudouridine(38-40) synthase TruA [Bacteroidales bacterium]MBP9587826.1 tRNA pseudouridine(38-40) synthase TruA [Bacteroidales bacterium]
MDNQRYFIHLAFDGTNYCGWQRQKNATSIQQEIEEKISILLKKPIDITGCGRTDTGVHASSFYAHFDFDPMPKQQLIILSYRLNHILPLDIAISEILPVKPEAHARYDALWRTYRYYISLRKNPFTRNYRWFRSQCPDIEKMNQLAEILLAVKDFTSFSKLHSDTENNLCTLTQAFWEIRKDELVFTITANRFLRNMVRAIVGTLWQLGKEENAVDHLREIIAKRDRSAAGPSVNPHALFLEEIIYPDDIFLV